MNPAPLAHTTQRRAARTQKSRYTRAWRPSWNDYAEVTMAAGENEVTAFLSRTLRRTRRAPRAAPDTLSAIARAGLIGEAPGWRSALRTSFAAIDRTDAAAAVAALEHILRRAPVTCDDKWTAFLRRAVATSRRMGIRPPAASRSRIAASTRASARRMTTNGSRTAELA